jgi:hypothetical protein
LRKVKGKQRKISKYYFRAGFRHPAARPDSGKLSAARYLREKLVICNP